MTETLIIFGLILLNGLFAMAEIALVSARKARLEAQASKGDKNAQKALKLSEHPDKFLSTVQIGITLIGILTGIYSGESIKSGLTDYLERFSYLREYSSGIATAIIVITITYFSLVIGELLPKRIGLSKPETIAKYMARPMEIVSLITYPFIWLLSKSTHLLVSIFNIKAKDTQVTEEEIKAIISEGTEQGTIEEAEQEIIERVFHLGDRSITSLMTHRSDIIWFDLNDNEAKIKQKIIQDPHSSYPICDGDIDVIKGMVSLKDLYVTDDMTAFSQYMQPALFIPENITAYTLLEKFKETNKHACFIVDEYGSVQGMVTLNNILEAIVGDLPQETKGEEQEIIVREDGSYLVDGQIQFYDFLSRFEKTEWMMEEEPDYDTLAGFILHHLERIPHTGDHLEWKGFRFEIIDMDAQRIDKVMVTISNDIRQDLEENQ